MTGLPETLTEQLGYRFDDPDILQQALTHRSAGRRNNERLEFLGDAILGWVIAAELYTRYPGAREGELSRLRSRLVRRESLVEVAHDLGIGRHLKLGPGERKSGGHNRNSILADALEAIFGAIYLDGGSAACRRCILRLFAAQLDEIPDTAQLKDAKTRLQEYLQASRKALPAYSVTGIAGDAHAQTFRVQCALSDIDIAPTEGEARSRRLAEQEAAARMIRQLDAE